MTKMRVKRDRIKWPTTTNKFHRVSVCVCLPVVAYYWMNRKYIVIIICAYAAMCKLSNVVHRSFVMSTQTIIFKRTCIVSVILTIYGRLLCDCEHDTQSAASSYPPFVLHTNGGACQTRSHTVGGRPSVNVIVNLNACEPSSQKYSVWNHTRNSYLLFLV